MFEGENILFIYSVLENKLQIQNYIVFIKDFLDKLPDNCNIYILTITDEPKLLLTKQKVKIFQEKINENNIIKILEEENIDFIIPPFGDKKIDKIFHNIYEYIVKKKIKLLYDDYFRKNNKITDREYIKNIAHKSGFNIFK